MLGLFLMAVEIGWFLARPAASELAAWWDHRHRLRLNRHTLATLAAGLGLAVLLAVPWHGRIALPAVLQAETQLTLFPPVAARIAELHMAEGQTVAAGAVLVVLQAPELDNSLARVERDQAQTFARIPCLPAAGVEQFSHVLVLGHRESLPPRPPEPEAINKGKGGKARKARAAKE